jgi:hypothetical protein
VPPVGYVTLCDQATIAHKSLDPPRDQTIPIISLWQITAESLCRPGDYHCHLSPRRLRNSQDSVVNF